MAQGIDDNKSPEKSGYRLTGREVEILCLIAQGHSSTKAADTLCVSKRTIDFHLANVFFKLRVDNRVQAILAAHRLGLIPSMPAARPASSFGDGVSRGRFDGGPEQSPAYQEHVFAYSEMNKLNESEGSSSPRDKTAQVGEQEVL